MRFISEDPASMLSVWMSPEELKNPSLFIKEFCDLNTISDCRFMLWQMLSGSLSTENQRSQASCAEQLYFFENLMPFVEAVYQLRDTSFLITDRITDVSENPHSRQPGPSREVYKSNSKKLKKYVRKHSFWYRQPIQEPYLTISEFFDACNLEDFKNRLYEILASCTKEGFYQNESPVDVLYFFERVEAIINAAYIILQTESVDIQNSTQKLSNEHDVSRVVLNDFFDQMSFKEWKHSLDEILHFSLSRQSANDWGTPIDTLPIFVHLVRLTEALHTINNSPL